MNNSTTLISNELKTGERIVWRGQPQQGFFLRSADAFLIPLSLMWGGFAIFWELTVIRWGVPFLSIWGIPFVLFGLYLMFGRFFVDIAQRRNTYYVLTNERAIILSGLLKNTRSVKLAALTEVHIAVRNNGKGTITFGPVSAMAWLYAVGGWPKRRSYQSPAFEMIEDVRMVYSQIKRLQNARQ